MWLILLFCHSPHKQKELDVCYLHRGRYQDAADWLPLNGILLDCHFHFRYGVVDLFPESRQHTHYITRLLRLSVATLLPSPPAEYNVCLMDLQAAGARRSLHLPIRLRLSPVPACVGTRRNIGFLLERQWNLSTSLLLCGPHGQP